MTEPSLFDAPAPRTTVDVSRLGEFESLLITESGGMIKFAAGDLLLSAEQTLRLLAHRKGA